MRVLIVDDEPLARARLRRLLQQQAGFFCIGEAENSQQAKQLVQQLQPDVILLDIEMPGENGLTLAEYLNRQTVPPAIIFVTAHPQHALEAYQAAPADYLLKPVSAGRLTQALTRLGVVTKAHLERHQATDAMISYQLAGVLRQIPLEQIYFFSADDKYVRIVFRDGEALTEQSLVQFEQQFPELLLRIHRRYLINRRYLTGLHNMPDGRHTIALQGYAERLPVSRRALGRVRDLLLSARNRPFIG